MTTKTDITLPPLPHEDFVDPGRFGVAYSANTLIAYARAAVEADRHARMMPSDVQPLLDMLDTLCTGLEWNIENHPAIMNESDSEALTEARALLSRYGSGQPVASAQPDDMPPLDDRATYPAAQVRRLICEDRARRAAPVIPTEVRETSQRALVAFRDSQLERQRALQTPEKKGVSIYGAARIAAQRNVDDADAALNWLAASVTQEPVLRIRKNASGQIYLTDANGEPFDVSKHVGTAFYAAPVAAQAQPWQELAAAMYQAAGAYDMPVRILDALSAAANDEPFAHLIDGLLPIECPEVNTQDREDAIPDRDAVDLAREGMALYQAGMAEHIICKELVRVAARAAKEKS